MSLYSTVIKKEPELYSECTNTKETLSFVEVKNEGLEKNGDNQITNCYSELIKKEPENRDSSVTSLCGERIKLESEEINVSCECKVVPDKLCKEHSSLCGELKIDSAKQVGDSSYEAAVVAQQLERNIKQLYAGHIIKEELFLGPEELHRPVAAVAPCRVTSRVSSEDRQRNPLPPHCGQEYLYGQKSNTPASVDTGREAPVFREREFRGLSENLLLAIPRNKTCSCSSHLQTHKLLHTGTKSYLCDTCKETFTWSSHIKRHKQLHTGEKRRMPRKKSNHNNARSRDARRRRVERANQSAEQIAARNAAQRLRTAKRRAHESQKQRDERLRQALLEHGRRESET